MIRRSKTRGRLWLAGLASALLCLSSVAHAQHIDGLVAYWNFDNDDFQDSIGVFHGTPEGDQPITFITGRPGFGKAILLEGSTAAGGANQHVVITGGEPDDLAFADGSMSVSAWFRSDGFDMSWQALVSKGEGNNWRIHRRGGENVMGFTGGAGGDTPSGTAAVNDEQWHHLVAISDATTQTSSLWIDGVLDAQREIGALTANGLRMMIGENPAARNRYWRGPIDDVAIWNRPLTETEITALFANPLSGLLAGDARPAIRINANGVGFEVIMTDNSGATVDTTPITATLNGAAVTTTQAKVGGVTTVTYSSLPDFMPVGTHTVGITAQVNGEAFADSFEFVVAPYLTLDPSWIAPASEYSTGTPGYKGRIHQMTVGRTPGDANSVWNAFRHLAGGYLDPATGNPRPNVVNTTAGSGADANGNFAKPDGSVYTNPWINMNQDHATAQIGSFQGPEFPDTSIPGIPGTGPEASNTDNIVMEAYAYLNFSQAPKLYRIGVNSDDGFYLGWGPNMRSAIFTAAAGRGVLSNAGIFNGGKGASDVVFDVAVPTGGAGVYLARLVWWEGGGGANCEVFQVLDNGNKVLIGNTTAGAIAAYKASGAGAATVLPADVVSAAPWPGQAGVNPQNTQVQIILADGTAATVDDNSINLTVNGVAEPKTVVRVGDKVRVTATVAGRLPPGIAIPVSIAYTAGGAAKTAAYAFTTINYPILPPSLGTPIGTGAERGMLWRTHLLQTAPVPARPNNIAGAEAQLLGEHGPSIHNELDWHEPQGADGFFRVDWVNFDQVPAPAGNFTANAAAPQDVADDYIPGTPVSPVPDWVAAECFAYLELQPGFYTMVVNSDDGFHVTMGNRSTPKYLGLGQFNAGRGSADTVFYFAVEQAGVYLFRLLWFEGTGGANVEWFTVNPDGSRALVNGAQTGAISAFRTRTVAEPELPPMAAEFNPPTIANGQITLSWDGAGILQESTDWVSWSNSTDQSSPQTVAPTGTMKIYRIQVSP